jgi:hypothetical protein
MKVLLVELNEITWNLIEPLMAQGKLPTFARLKREGTWAAPVSVDRPPQMDPWITWTTVHTGRPQSDHNVFFLQQPPETIGAPRLWEICRDRGMSIGVYGSLCSWPPRPANGFHVPDTFAPDPSTYPESLRPIQELNLTYTRSIRLAGDEDGLRAKAALAARLVTLGLSPSTIVRLAAQLAHERMNPSARWRRVALQPLVNFDFFKRLYRRHRPQFASFHTNHVAHYMHTYWRAMQPEVFPQDTSPAEVRAFGGAVEHGYRTADRLLADMLGLLDDETVLVVASSMGQKPYVAGAGKGKSIVQLRSLDRLLQIIGVQGRAKALSTMSDQFNIYADSPETRDLVVGALRAAYVDRPDQLLFHSFTVGDTITASLRLQQAEAFRPGSRCVFPHRDDGTSIPYEELVYDTGMVKSGCHDEKGILLVHGPRVRRGGHVPVSTNLDIAPTVLTMLGVPIPAEMKGRVMWEALARGEDAAAPPLDERRREDVILEARP